MRGRFNIIEIKDLFILRKYEVEIKIYFYWRKIRGSYIIIEDIEIRWRFIFINDIIIR